jgi:hypothetical protein
MFINRKSLLIKIIVFSLIAIIGYSFYTRTFSNYQVSSSGTTGIVAGMSPADDDKMKVTHFDMYVNVQKQSILLGFSISYYAKGNYTIAFTLPYRISTTKNLGLGKWYVRNAESGSIVMVVVENENDSETGWIFQRPHAIFYTEDKICTTIFETNSLNLAFGSSMTLDVNDKLDELREISWITLIGGGFNGTVQVALPFSAVITGTTHQMERVDPTEDYQVYEFMINGFMPLQVQFIDSAQRRDFETYLLFSGTFFGVAAAGFAEIVIGYISTKYNTNKKKNHNGVTEMKNQSKTKKDEEKTDKPYSKRILDLIELVEKHFSKKKYLLKVTWERILTGLVPIFIVILVVSWMFFLAFDLVMSYLPIAESRDVVVLFVSTIALTITLVSFIIKLGSDLGSVFAELNDKKIAEWNFKKMKDAVEIQDMPLLRALVRMKSMQPNIDLKDIYSVNEPLFTEKALLARLYE